MSAVVIDIVSWIALLAGSFFFVVGAAGLVRMPDLYTRIHAASVSDTLGAGLILFGLMLQAGFTLNGVKLGILGALFFITGPVATHALAQAALHMRIEPELASDGASAPDPAPATQVAPQQDSGRLS